jgi:ubiquinone/menaquinone biosynthesis C-methylase UbiE
MGLARQSEELKCAGCGATYKLVNGDMVSFIPPGVVTALDGMDYDAVYSVDADSSDRIYRQCRRFLGDLLPPQVSSYLEVGAGTGLFTLAYLDDASPKHALVTDISPKMLEACRQRLHTRRVEEKTEVSYALWDGSARCFAEEAFDLVAGVSVLHHILDYDSVLEILHGALAKNGRAIFLEPSLAFHHAMVTLVANVISTIPQDEPGWSADYSKAVGLWIAENYVRMKYRGDELALEGFEDKHIFDEVSLRSSGMAAGFAAVHLIPFGEANEAWSALTVYANHLPLPPSAKEQLLLRCASMMPGPFFYLAPEERAPSFLVVMEKGGPRALHPPCKSFPDPVYSHPQPRFQFDLQVQVDSCDEDDGSVRAGITGWILGDVDVHYVQLERGGCARFPVGGLRMDVANAMNGDRQLPAERAMCSGIVQVREQRIPQSSLEPVTVVAFCPGGEKYKIGELHPPLESVRLQSCAHLMLPRHPSIEPVSPASGVGQAGEDNSTVR